MKKNEVEIVVGEREGGERERRHYGVKRKIYFFESQSKMLKTLI